MQLLDLLRRERAGEQVDLIHFPAEGPEIRRRIETTAEGKGQGLLEFRASYWAALLTTFERSAPYSSSRRSSSAAIVFSRSGCSAARSFDSDRSLARS